jgi:MFS transporter, DHA2 family, methylenomycin A resistance protein
MAQQTMITNAPSRAGSRGPVLVVMCVGYFLVLLDVTVVNVALPAIGGGLGSSVAGLQWVVDGYSLALACLLLASGTVGDLRGHRRIVLAGLGAFGIASLGCALAPNTGVLIGTRVLQGVGAALLLPGTLAIISRSYPGRAEQARAIGIWAAVGSIALPAGPLLGGVLVQGLGWRWVFAINIPIVLVAWIVVARRVPGDATNNVTTGRRLDRPGTVLAALTLAALTLAVIQAGHAGLDPVAIGGAVVAVLAAVAFVRVERRAHDPMLPLDLFRGPAFTTANAAAGAMNLGTLGLLFVLTLYLQTVQSRSALLAGVAVLPLFLPLTILAPIAGRAAGRYGSKPVMIIGLVLAAFGVALVATWTAAASYPSLLPALLCWGVGLALLTPAVVAAAIAAAPADRSGLASGVNNTARQAGGAIGIAVYGAIAGAPGDAASFLTGMHLTGVITAVLFAAAALATAVFIPLHRAR